MDETSGGVSRQHRRAAQLAGARPGNERKDKDKEDKIKESIKQIEGIEGSEGLLGRYWQVRYLIWQAKRAVNKDRLLVAALGTGTSACDPMPMMEEAIQHKAIRTTRRFKVAARRLVSHSFGFSPFSRAGAGPRQAQRR